MVAYADGNRVDYIDMVGTMTAALTSRIDTPEFQARTMAMQAVYWALGIHDPDFVARFGKPAATYKVLQAKAAWAVLSFQVVQPDNPGLQAAEKATAQQLAGPRRYALHVYRWGKEHARSGRHSDQAGGSTGTGLGLRIREHRTDPARQRAMADRHFDADVVVAGGGPAGSATAIACASRGLRVVLCEREPGARDRPGETLHPGVEPLLAQLGVADRLPEVVGARHEGLWIEWGGPRRFEAFGSDAAGPWQGL